MFFIPYSTDAPIYYWPFATVGLILVNVVIFTAATVGTLPNPEDWILKYGEGLTPLQWVLSMFMHADFFHLLGNMFFLWVFGLVVEGKLGWKRFLSCYLSIGILQSILEQTLQLVLGGHGGSLGASSAIYGIMAMAAIWAPKNTITFSYFFWIMFFVHAGTFDIPIMMVAGFYIGIDVLFTFFLGLSSSSWLHVGGVLIGAPLGFALLKYGVVDCEGWDIIHVWRDDYGRKLSSETPDKQIEEKLAERRKQRESQIQEEGREQLATFLKERNAEAALGLYKKLSAAGHDLRLPRDALLQLIAAMHRRQDWTESCPLMAEVLERFPNENNSAVHIKLAQICVVQLDRPGRALELLRSVDLKKLPPEQLKLAHKIARRAQQMQEEGVVELDDSGW
jgi:membrane associated rhomboid family serine protease